MEAFTGWLATANQRVVRTIGSRPTDRALTDKSAMLALPPVAPVTSWRKQERLGRDYYVRVAGNDYSVAPSAIGRMLDVHADLDQVRIRCDGKLAGEHPRVWARGLTRHRSGPRADRCPEPGAVQRRRGLGGRFRLRGR